MSANNFYPSPAKILRKCFIDLGIVTDPLTRVVPHPRKDQWPAYYPALPDAGDNAVSFRDSPAGLPDGRYMRTGERIEFPAVDITVRGIDEDTGADMSKTICDALDFIIKDSIVAIGSRTWTIQSVKRMPAGSMGEEEGKRRQLFSIITRMTYREVL